MWRTSDDHVSSRAVAVRVALLFWVVVQLVERAAVNRHVAGSSPAFPAKFAISAVKVPFV